MKWNKRICLIMVCVLTVMSLAGCSSLMGDPEPVAAGETIDSNPKWINSDIEGAIDKDTKTDIKDDFYTAVNRDWLLNAKVTDEKPEINEFVENEDLLRKRKLAIVSGASIISSNSAAPEELNENPAGLSADLLEADSKLTRKFTSLAGNWDARNSLGAEPVRPYIDEIEEISDMDSMTAYLLNEDGMNFALDYPVEFDVTASASTNWINTVRIGTCTALTLGNQDEYAAITMNGLLYRKLSNEQVGYTLKRLGCSSSQINRIISESYRFEIMLAEKMKSNDEQQSSDYLNASNYGYSFKELGELEGAYPLTAVLKKYGLDSSDSYVVCEPDYVKAVGRLYNKENLKYMKSYFIVRTISYMLPLLDRQSYEKSVEMEKMLSDEEDDSEDGTGSGDTQEKSGEQKEQEILLDKFLGKYLPGPMDEIYVAQYCTKEQKQQIEAIVADVLKYYRSMLKDEDWLTEGTRKKAVEKLDNICIRSVYPDSFVDYTGLDLSDDENMVDAVADINEFSLEQMHSGVNGRYDRNFWDMSLYSTTVANAYYNPTDNSINILAGILSNGFMYDESAPYEQNLARIGSIIGHEITHAFDDNGSKYDSEGRQVTWWDLKDVVEFQKKLQNLSMYYAAITPYPGAVAYSGQVQGEAIADMGAVKCMLGIADSRESFDYELFFRSYASLWQCKRQYSLEVSYAGSDVHPLAFLRTNVTLQQFDRFYETFDIKKGDGMYIEPDKRIMIW